MNKGYKTEKSPKKEENPQEKSKKNQTNTTEKLPTWAVKHESEIYQWGQQAWAKLLGRRVRKT